MDEVFEARIESLSSTGAGVARAAGLVVFVDDVAPGDRVRLRLKEKKKTFAIAELVEVLEPGSSRRKPPCPVAADCGGCQWQHVKYAEQLAQKSKIIQDALERIGKLNWPVPIEVVPSPNEFRYRNRIQVQAQNGKVGYFAKKSHRLVEIEDCLIAEESLIPQLLELKNTKTFERVELRTDGEAGGFSQVNTRQNENLVRYVCELTEKLSFSAIYDFYCGSGNFSFPVKQLYPDSPLVGVEMNPGAIRKAQEKASRMKLQDVNFIAQDCSEYLKLNELVDGCLTILDPPRAGCEEKLIKSLSEKGPVALIYISCNPATLARDIRLLQRYNPSWRLESVRGFDFFPQTPHVETACLLRRE